MISLRQHIWYIYEPRRTHKAPRIRVSEIFIPTDCPRDAHEYNNLKGKKTFRDPAVMNMIHCTHDNGTQYHIPITQGATFLHSRHWLKKAFMNLVIKRRGWIWLFSVEHEWHSLIFLKTTMRGQNDWAEISRWALWKPREIFDVAHQGRSQEGIHAGAVSRVRMVSNAPYSFVLGRFKKGSSIRACWVVHSRGGNGKVVAVFSVKCGGR